MKTKHHTYEFTDRQKEIINGCLLGDGSLSKLHTANRNSSFHTVHCEAQLGLIEWLSNHLSPLNCRISKRLNDVGRLNKTNVLDLRTYYTLDTLIHPYLTELEKNGINVMKKANIVIN